MRDHHGHTPLHAAAEAGDLDSVRLLVSAGAEINTADDSGMTPLHDAAYRERPSVVEFLVESGADVEAEMGDKDYSATALRMAVKYGHIDVARYLAPKVKNINQKSKTGFPLLYDAVTALLPPQHVHPESGHFDRYPGDRDDSIEPWEAASRLKLLMVGLLLAQGADANLRTRYGETPLHGAVDYADEYAAEMLLTHGADIDGAVEGGAHLEAGPEDGETPLHYAAKFGREEMAQLLVRRGAKVNVRTKGGATPLLYALEMGHGSIVRLLLAAGAEMPNLTDLPDRRFLHKAWQAGDNELFEFLLRNGADINERDGGETLLHRAACDADLGLAEFLLKRSADVDAKNWRGTTPLHCAVWKGHREMILLLLAARADVNAQDNNRDTPLHTAALWGHKEAIELLLGQGADFAVKNDRDRTSLEEAAALGRSDIVQLLTVKAEDTNAGVQDRGNKK